MSDYLKNNDISIKDSIDVNSIIHQMCNSTKSVSYKDIKKLKPDLKLVYATLTEENDLNERDSSRINGI